MSASTKYSATQSQRLASKQQHTTLSMAILSMDSAPGVPGTPVLGAKALF